MFWEGGFCHWEMSALPLALADREGFCVRWSGWASPLPAQCELWLPLTLSEGRTLVEQCHDWSISTESHQHWPVWCDAYSSPSIWPGFPEGHGKYCPVCTTLVERCPWCTWNTLLSRGYTAGTVLLAERKAASCRAAARAAGAGAGASLAVGRTGGRAAGRKTCQPHTSLGFWKETICLTSLPNNIYIMNAPNTAYSSSLESSCFQDEYVVFSSS